jgi:hypothetical protein
MQIQDMRKLLDSIQSQIRTFDLKAQIALGMNSLISGLIGTELLKSTEYVNSNTHLRFIAAVTLASIALLSIGISFSYGLRTVRPQIHPNTPKSHLFLADLAHEYGTEYERAAKHIVELSQERVAFEMGIQIQVNSLVCAMRASYCRKTLAASEIGLAGYLLSPASVR